VRARRLRSAAVTALTLVAVGCGDDDGAEITDAAGKAEFVSQANEICKRGSAKVQAAFEQLQGKPSRRQTEKVIAEVGIPTIQADVDAIRALGIPEGDRDEVEAMLQDTERIIDQARVDIGAFFADKQGKDPWADVDRRLAAYGLTACAEA